MQSHPLASRLVGLDFEFWADCFFKELFDVLQGSGGGTGTAAASTLVMNFDLFTLYSEDVDSTAIVCKGRSNSYVE